MSIQKIYFYPKLDYQALSSPNPYTFFFEKTLNKHFQIVNKENNKIGVLNLFRYLWQVDWYVFNWIEDLPFLRYGKIQLIFFYIFLLLCKLFNKKICWILHNRYSHDTEKNRWTDFMFHTMMMWSSIILTHSKSGIAFGKEKYPRYAHKIKYLIHPIQESFLQSYSRDEKKYDILFWGTIHPYKGIIPFLAFLKQKGVELRILIAGKCFDPEYKKQIEAYLSEKVIFKDQFHSMDDIAAFASQSRYILFTYKADSVLSSGSFMDSIRMGTNIIGPHLGAFKDLSSYGFVNTYNTYQDILNLVNDNRPQAAFNRIEVEDFCTANSWSSFGNKLYELITGQPCKDKNIEKVVGVKADLP